MIRHALAPIALFSLLSACPDAKPAAAPTPTPAPTAAAGPKGDELIKAALGSVAGCTLPCADGVRQSLEPSRAAKLAPRDRLLALGAAESCAKTCRAALAK